MPTLFHSLSPRHHGQGRHLVISMLLLFLAGQCVSGCQLIGVAIHQLKPRYKDYQPSYEGLNGQKIAVLVNADPSVLYEFPNCQLAIAQNVVYRMVNGMSNPDPERMSDDRYPPLDGAALVDPAKIIAFQHRDPYWNTLSKKELADKFHVNRLVWIELLEFAVHEPGNAMVFKGRATVHLRVYAADNDRPNDAIKAWDITVKFPDDAEEGKIDIGAQLVQQGTYNALADAICAKFMSHRDKVEKDVSNQ